SSSSSSAMTPISSAPSRKRSTRCPRQTSYPCSRGRRPSTGELAPGDVDRAISGKNTGTMSEKDHRTSTPSDEQRPAGQDQSATEPSLADTDESQEERGRIGYGPNERKSSWILGAILVLI